MSGRLLSQREENVLRALGAKPTINSGATLGDCDGVIPAEIGAKRIGFNSYTGVAVEVKSTDRASFRVTKAILKKLREQAESFNRMPALAVDLDKKVYVLLDVDDFLDLLQHEQELQKQVNNLQKGIDILDDDSD